MPRRARLRRFSTRLRSQVVRVGGDPRAELLVRPLELGMVAVHVLATEPEQLLVVSGFEVVPTGAVDGSHLVLLESCGSGLCRRRADESPLRPADVKSLSSTSGGVKLSHGLVRVGAEGPTA